MNKISLDLKFKSAEVDYQKSLSSIINKFECVFLNYNNIIEEVKRIKLDEIYKLQETQIDNQNNITNYPTGNLTNNKLLLKQNTLLDKKGSPKNEDLKMGKARMSFLMTSNEQVIHEERSSYGILNSRKYGYVNNNLMRKVTKINTKGGISGLEGLKKLRNVQTIMNTDNSQTKHQSSNSIVNLSKPNKITYYGASGLFKKEGESKQVDNTITEIDENEEKDKTTDNFYKRNDTRKGKNNANDEKIQISKQTDTVSCKKEREKSASSFDSQQIDNVNFNETYNNTVSEINEKKPRNDKGINLENQKYLKIVVNPNLKENNDSNQIKNNQLNENNKNIITENTNSKNSIINTIENFTSDEGRVQSKFLNQKKTTIGASFQNPVVRRRISKIDVFNEQNSSLCPINSFIGGSVIDINHENDRYISEIKQLKSEVIMYKQYITAINDRLENEVKVKNSYLVDIKEFEKKNKVIYKTELDNLHVCFEIYKDFYQNELDNRKDVIINLHNTLEEVLAK